MNDRYTYELCESDEQQRFRLLRQHLDQVSKERVKLMRGKEVETAMKKATQ